MAGPTTRPAFHNAATQDSSIEDSVPAGASPSVRLFVGGLPPDVTMSELQARFKPFGTVLKLEIVPQKEEQAACRGFAYVDLAAVSDATLNKCFTVYNGAKWRGGKLRVEKARATFLDLLKAEWVAQTEGQKKDAETNEEQKKEERLDKAKQIIEPLRLKWGSWQFERRTKVVPAAGGVKIKKSFRNVPEKSLWELEGLGGEGALTEGQAIASKEPIYIAADNRGPPQDGAHVNGRKYFTEERHANASLEEGHKATPTGQETEVNVGSEDDFGSVSTREGSESEGDVNEVNGVVKELTPWEKLMQKAAAGQEDDDFIDEEMGSLEGFGTAAETQQNLGSDRDAGGKQGPAQAKDEVREKGGQKEEKNLENEKLRERKVAKVSDWERLMQKASGVLDAEDSEETQPISNKDLAEEKGLAEAGPEELVHQEKSEERSEREQSEKNVAVQGLGEGARQIRRRAEKSRHLGRALENETDSGGETRGTAHVRTSSIEGAKEGGTNNLSNEFEQESLGDEASPSESDVSKGDDAMSGSDVSEEEEAGSESDVSDREVAGSESNVSESAQADGFGEDLSRREEAGCESDVSKGKEGDGFRDDVSKIAKAESNRAGSPLLNEAQLLEPAGAGEQDSEDHNKDSKINGAVVADEDDAREMIADVSTHSEGRKGPEREPLTSEEGAIDLDFEVAPVGDAFEDDQTEADGPDEIRTPHRTAEDEEIARQLAEERKRQLGILGAMFPDDARFFSEERSQRPMSRFGFVPVARYDPSAQEPPTKEGDPSEPLQPVDSVPRSEEVAEKQGTESENAQRQGDRERIGAEISRISKSERESRKRKAESVSVPAKKQFRTEERESKSDLKKSHLGRTENTVTKGASKEGSASGGREKGDTAVGMVSEVVAQLSRQVLKYLDPALLQQLAPAVKESGPKEGAETSRRNSRKVAEMSEERRASDGTQKEARQNESGRNGESEKKGNDARTKRKRERNEREESRKEERAFELTVNGSESLVNSPPQQEQDKMQGDEKESLSLEERRHLKREKRAKRRTPDEVKNSVNSQADVPQSENEVKHEVFVNPNWRALVGYVGNEKPTFSLSSILPQIDVAPPEPSDLPAATESMASELPPHADVSQALPVVVQDVPKPSLVTDEEVGLSFVRSENAEKEWLASKSALAIDYKRKKRVASRVAPRGGLKRRS